MGGNVPGIPGACATRNFTYLARGPLGNMFNSVFTVKPKMHLKRNITRVLAYRRLNIAGWGIYQGSKLMVTEEQTATVPATMRILSSIKFCYQWMFWNRCQKMWYFFEDWWHQSCSMADLAAANATIPRNFIWSPIKYHPESFAWLLLETSIPYQILHVTEANLCWKKANI